MKINVNSVITGNYTQQKVWIDGKELDPNISRKVYDFAPSFLWGYNGSGPAQASLALLLVFGCSSKEALEWVHQFKIDFVAKIVQADFEIEGKRVIDWIAFRKLFASNFENTGEDR